MNTCGFDEFEVDEVSVLEGHVSYLNQVNFELARLVNIKEKIEKKILEETGRVIYDEHGVMKAITYEGRQTESVGKYKLTIKTECNYSIDINKYEQLKRSLLPGLDPVKKKIQYSINKSAYHIGMQNAKTRELLSDMVTMKYAKPSVSLEAKTK
jgi:hypothetical protein